MTDDTNADHAWLDGIATTCSTRVTDGHLETSGTIALMVADDIVPETARRELDRCLKQAPQIADISTDDSWTDQEPGHRRKRGKPLKSGKVRTADSTVIKHSTWPHELVYTSGGEPVTYEHIAMSQFVTGYLSVLDMVKRWDKQCMLKHLKKLMADTSMYMGGSLMSLSWGVAPAAREWKGRVAGC